MLRSFSILYISLFLTSYACIANEKLNPFHEVSLSPVNDSSELERLNEIAWLLRNSDPNKSVQILDSIIKLAKEKHLNNSLATAYNSLGILYASAGDYESANNCILKGYNLFFQEKNELGLGKSLDNMAVVYYYQHQVDKSLEILNHAIEIYKKSNQVGRIGLSYFSIGNIYKEKGEYKKAQEYYNKSLNYLESAKDKKAKIEVLISIAELNMLKNELDKASNQLNEIEHLCIQLNDLKECCLFYHLRGDLNLANKLYTEAENDYFKVLVIAQQLNDIKLRIQSIHKIIELYKEKQDYRTAFKFQNQYHHLKDSLSKVQNYMLLSKIELQDEYDEKLAQQNRRNEIKKESQQSEISYQKRISVILLNGLVFLIIFGILAFINYRQKLKNARMLANQRQEILLKNEALRQQMQEDRQKTEIIEFINHENELLSVVAKETDNTVFILSPNGTIEWVNEAFQRLSGFTLEEFKKIRGSRIQDASLSETINENLLKCISSKKPVKYISKTWKKNKKTIWIHTTLTPLLDENNEVVRLIAIDSDITKLKEVEDEIAKKNSEITSSLEYARRIQNSLLPPFAELDTIFMEYFIINLPQSIVSGDFYWAAQKNGKTLAIVADSTGHGVPGAFMSLLGISSLQEIVYKMEFLDPVLILEQLREKIVSLLHYGSNHVSSSESWDIAVCVIDQNSHVMQYAGSNNSVIILRDDVLIELKPDKFFVWDEQANYKEFAQQSIDIQPTDKVYLFTDGFSDQFGGEDDKKFSRRKLKKLLLDIYTLPMESQKDILSMVLKDWKGDNEQVDDIMVLAFQV